MLIRSLIEYGRLGRSDVPDRLLRHLQRSDQGRAEISGDSIFDWEHLHHVVAKSYVGVIQVAGLQVEILPKIDPLPARDDAAYREGGRLRGLAQSNLLYMLSLTRKIPILPRDLASLRLDRMPLLEALICVFAQRLVEELSRGLHQAYVYREENGSFFKGKLLVAQHVRVNATQSHKCYVGFEEFIADTWLNRILKAACCRLLRISRWVATQQRIREALLLLSDVEICDIQPADFDRVQINRNTDRFEPLFDFAWMVLFGNSPTPAMGEKESFSLLFPMEKLFEEFIARFVHRYSSEIGIDRCCIHIQASSRRRWLLTDENDRGRFRLKPDIVIDGPGDSVALIVDTKWKRPKSDHEDSRNGVAQSDLYQLFAYAQRYDSPDNLLLYPRIKGVSSKRYRVAGDNGKCLRTGFVDIGIDLMRGRSLLINELRDILLNNSLPPHTH